MSPSKALAWLPDLHQEPSPNFDFRPNDTAITLIVVHAISLPPGKFGGPGIIDLFSNRLDPKADPYYGEIHQLKVSAHFLIRRDGEVIQFVSCLDRAWHAGESAWQSQTRCNDFSIGIELEGCDQQAFEEPQYRSLNTLLCTLYEHFPIKAVAGHSDIAPGRKTDPGPNFDWLKVHQPAVTV